MFVVVICCFAFNSLWAPSRQVLGYAANLTGTDLLQRTNIARTANENKPLTYNATLAQAAQAKASDMAARNYWSHATPEGNQPWHFVQQAGYAYTAVGENLAYGFDGSSATVNAWMNSPEHRANILSKDYEEVGFGIAQSKNFQGKGEETIIVAMYGTPNYVSAALAPQQAQALASGSVLPARDVSRLEATISTTSAALIAVAAAVITGAGALFVALKHGRLLRRTLVQGEVFVVKHHLLDLILLSAGGIGFVITRSAGMIH